MSTSYRLPSRLGVGCLVVWAACCGSFAHAQFDAQAPEPIGKLRGAVLLHGGGELTDKAAARFLALAGGKEARIVVIFSADAEPAGPAAQEALSLWKGREAASVELVHAASRDEADRPEFAQKFEQATGVWFIDGQQSRIASRYAGTAVEQALLGVLARGGVVGGTGAGAAVLCRAMLAGDASQPEIGQGLDLVPGVVIAEHFLTRQRQPGLMSTLKSRPGLVGLGIDTATTLIVRGRSLEVIGDSCAVVCLAASKSRSERIERLVAGKTADLIALSRAAVARSLPGFPPAELPAPEVPSGTLVIVGGGGMPKGLFERFVELSGGKEAEIVYIPCTESDEVPADARFVESFRRAGAKRATLLHTKDRKKASSDDEFLAPLTTATGIWFGGGRQWNLVDSYANTTAHRLMHGVLARGGAIGGSSAGASIQGDYMPRGDPLGNLNIIAEGYERGLGFLTGVAIDQHFTQRKRHPDMTLLVKTFPQLLGIGLDEATAIVVQKSTAEVVGANRVFVYDAKNPPSGDEDYLSLAAGQKYDLKARKLIEP